MKLNWEKTALYFFLSLFFSHLIPPHPKNKNFLWKILFASRLRVCVRACCVWWLSRTPFGTICPSTSASCAWRMSRVPSGLSMRSSTTAAGPKEERLQGKTTPQIINNNRNRNITDTYDVTETQTMTSHKYRYTSERAVMVVVALMTQFNPKAQHRLLIQSVSGHWVQPNA